MTSNPQDFDGCNRRCRQARAHTLVWGECVHAPEPEPTVSLSRVYTDTDGLRSIGFDTYTVPQLARLIEGAVGDPLRAASAARAIVHRHDPEPAVVAPPANQAAEDAPFGSSDCTCVPFTRQTDPPRILNQPTDTVDMISGWERGADCPHHTPAVVSPPPATRADAWHEAADVLAALDPVEAALAGEHAWADAAALLRRLAAETPQPEPATRDEEPGNSNDALIEEYLRFLRGQGPEPDLSDLAPTRREAITGQFEIVKALADRDPNLPSLDRDPVARRLGLHEGPKVEARQQADTETQAHPPRHRWSVETRDDDVDDQWAPGTPITDRNKAVERYEHVTRNWPTWKDGTPVQRRLVRMTTTYTVEQHGAVPVQPAAADTREETDRA